MIVVSSAAGLAGPRVACTRRREAVEASPRRLLRSVIEHEFERLPQTRLGLSASACAWPETEILLVTGEASQNLLLGAARPRCR